MKKSELRHIIRKIIVEQSRDTRGKNRVQRRDGTGPGFTFKRPEQLLPWKSNMIKDTPMPEALNPAYTGCDPGFAILVTKECTDPNALTEYCMCCQIDGIEPSPTNQGDYINAQTWGGADIIMEILGVYTSVSYYTGYDFTSTISCTGFPIDGCTDPNALNYDPTATNDDGSCAYNTGCTDPTATNYDPNATNDDGSCIYPAACDTTPASACAIQWFQNPTNAWAANWINNRDCSNYTWPATNLPVQALQLMQGAPNPQTGPYNNESDIWGAANAAWTSGGAGSPKNQFIGKMAKGRYAECQKAACNC